MTRTVRSAGCYANEMKLRPILCVMLASIGCGPTATPPSADAAAPYSGCASSSIGAACPSDPTSPGFQCQRLNVGDPSATSFCTRSCASDQDCPAANGSQARCVTANIRQCILLCDNDGGTCPAWTRCVPLTYVGGMRDFLCFPQ